MTTPPADQLIGRTLGRYRIERLLGRGGTGSVYIAADSALNRTVAIKTLHPHLADDKSVQARFVQEARRIAALDHPQIVQIYDVNFVDGYLYFVMPHLEAGSLRTFMTWHKKKNTRIKIREALHLTWQVAQALQFAHERGIVHRDVKPGNVLLRHKSHPSTPGHYDALLADFGVAALQQDLLQRSRLLEGTIPYMSPEQCLGQAVDHRTDIYSLGVTLYELLTGRLPYQAKTLPDAQAVHQYIEVPHPREERERIPELLDAIIVRCLQKDPRDRYAHMAAFMTEFTQLARGSGRRVAPADEIETQQPEAQTVTQQGKIIWQIDGGNGGTYEITSDLVVLGRSRGADLTLDDEGVSRRHASLERLADGRYQLTDLDSRNGTYLATSAQRVEQPVIITTGREVLLGHNVRLNFELGDPDEGETKALPPLDAELLLAKASSPLPNAAPGEMLATLIDKTELSLEPGETAEISLTLRNLSQRVMNLRLQVTGVPEHWVHLLGQAYMESTTLTLQAGAVSRVTLYLAPPRHPDSEAGNYPITLNVSTRNLPRAESIERVALTLLPMHAFDANLRPRLVPAGRSAKIALRHRGNSWTEYEIKASDETHRLRFSLTQDSVTLTPQTPQANITLRPRVAQRPLLGSKQELFYSVTVRENRAGGTTQEFEGAVMVKPRVSWRVLALTALLLIFLVGGALAVLADSDGDGALTLIADACPFESGDSDNGCPATVFPTQVIPPTATATNTPTVTPTATDTPEPSATPTLDLPPAERLALSGVESNAFWTELVGADGYRQDFDNVPMVLVPSGCFTMGSAVGELDEQPTHEVCIDTPFWLDAAEVSQGQFALFGGQAAETSVFQGPERPLENVSWFEAQAYCGTRGGSLPSEAQWAYAASGPSNRIYPWGDAWQPDNAVWSGSAFEGTAPTDSLPEGASWVGALHLSGNVWEWTSTIYDPQAFPFPYVADDGREASQEDPSVTHVIRGGSWLGDQSVLRPGNRDGFRADFTGSIIGFRCARPYTP